MLYRNTPSISSTLWCKGKLDVQWGKGNSISISERGLKIESVLQTAKKPDELGSTALQVAAVRLAWKYLLPKLGELGYLGTGLQDGILACWGKERLLGLPKIYRKLAGGQGPDSLSPQSHYHAWSRKPSLHSDDPCQSLLSQCRSGWPGEHQPGLEHPRRCSGCFGCCCVPHLEPAWCLVLHASVVPTVLTVLCSGYRPVNSEQPGWRDQAACESCHPRAEKAAVVSMTAVRGSLEL